MISIDKIKLFSSLSQEEIQFLSKNITKRTCTKDQIIFSPIDRCSGLNLVFEGEAKLCKFSGDGTEHIISTVKPGDIFGEALVFDNSYYPVHVISVGDCILGSIKMNEILELTRLNSRFTMVFLAELSKKIRILNEKIEYLSYPHIKQRLAKFLLKAASEQNSNQIRLKITKQYISQIVGTSREVVSRNLSSMEKEGYFKADGKVFHLDTAKLEKTL